jgi:hypothetical protein
LVVITIISPGPFLFSPNLSTHLDTHNKTKCGLVIGGDQFDARIRGTRSGGVLDGLALGRGHRDDEDAWCN